MSHFRIEKGESIAGSADAARDEKLRENQRNARRLGERFGFVETNRQVEQVRQIGDEPRPAPPTEYKIVSVAERPELWTAAYHQVALPTLPPGSDGKAPDPRAALTPPSPPKAAAVDDPHRIIGG